MKRYGSEEAGRCSSSAPPAGRRSPSATNRSARWARTWWMCGGVSDSACFVQFPHPGGEHWPDPGGGKGWNTYDSRHARKFMQLRGNWIAGDGSAHGGELWAWGEWEAQSELVRTLDASRAPGLTHHLWRPHYVIPRDGYGRLHNTDPFIFGERFLYSNCLQPSRPGLRRLGRGSVIAFGSKRGGWVLDTVLVVADHLDYAAPEARLALAHEVPEAFLAVTAGPLADNGEEATLRLYRARRRLIQWTGCSASSRPGPWAATRASSGQALELDERYFTRTLAQNNKRTCGLGSEVLRALWERLAAQVREAGLVLGTYAEQPEQH